MVGLHCNLIISGTIGDWFLVKPQMRWDRNTIGRVIRLILARQYIQDRIGTAQTRIQCRPASGFNSIQPLFMGGQK